MSNKKNLSTLIESNIEKAEIVLAVKGEIEDKIQRQSEILSNLSVDVLGPLVDRIKAEHGLDAAESFRNRISTLLNQALQTLLHVKDEISTETLKLTGDVTNGPDIADIGAGEIEQVSVDTDDITNFDMVDDADIEDDISEPVPTEREMKESTEPKKLGVVLESIKGTRGTKYFESPAEMKTWLTENQNKIKKVINILK